MNMRNIILFILYYINIKKFNYTILFLYPYCLFIYCAFFLIFEFIIYYIIFIFIIIPVDKWCQ